MKKIAAYFYRSSPARILEDLRRRRTGQSSQSEPARSVVFVLSTGRVGSKTLSALFRKAPGVDCAHEPRPKLFGLSKAAYAASEEGGAGLVVEEALAAVRSERWERAKEHGRVYFETSPQATFLAPAILRLHPDAGFVHLARDPFDVIRSGMRRKWYSGNAFDNWRITPREDSAGHGRWQEMSLLEKNAWLWHSTNEWIENFLEELPQEQKVFGRSEDLFAGDEALIGRVAKLLGVDPPQQTSQDAVLGKQLNRQNTGAFEWDEQARATVLEEVGDCANRLGYGPKASS